MPATSYPKAIGGVCHRVDAKIVKGLVKGSVKRSEL